jgi:hypothetical protein
MLPTSVSSLEEAQRQEREQQRPKRELRGIDVIMKPTVVSGRIDSFSLVTYMFYALHNNWRRYISLVSPNEKIKIQSRTGISLTKKKD